MRIYRIINITNCLRIILMTLVVIGFGSVLFVFFQMLVDILVLLCITLIFAINGCKINRKLVISCLVFAVFCISHSLAVQLPLLSYAPLMYRFVMAILVLTAFNNDYDGIKDTLIKVLKFFCILSAINVLSIHVLPSSFFSSVISDSNYYTQTILYLFNTSAYILTSPIAIMRNAGPFWEPGVLQIPMNLLVYLILYEKKEKITKAFLPIFIIISTFSATGYVILGIILLVKYYKKISFSFRGFMVVLSLLLMFSMVGYALRDKFNNTNKSVENSSSLLRMYDLIMSSKIALDHWSLGVGYSPERVEKLQNINTIKLNDQELSLERGVTNSVLQIFVYFGFILAISYFWIVWRQNLFKNRKLFFIIWMFMLASEPVVFTSLSWMIFVTGLNKMNFNNEI